MGNLTNPNRTVKVQQLIKFKTELETILQSKSIETIEGLQATTVEGALAELIGKIVGLGSVLRYKGTVADKTALDAITNPTAGDTYNMTAASGNTPAGTNWTWSGSAWDPLGGTVDLTPYMQINNYKSKGAANKPIYFDADGLAQACTYELNKSVPADAEFTDTKVTAVANHYAPAADAEAELTATQDGETAASEDDTDVAVVVGAKIQRDAKGHVTGIKVSKKNVKNSVSAFKTKQTAVADPTAGNSTDTIEFIATASQNANGDMTLTKQAVRAASASQSGVMSAAHYTKLEAIEYATDSDIAEIFA